MKIKKLIFAVLSLFFLTSCSTTPPEKEELKNIIDIEQTVYEENSENTPAKTGTATPLYNEYTVSLDINPETGIIKGVEKVSYINKTGKDLNSICFNVYFNAFSNESSIQPYFSEYREKIFANGRDYGYFNISSVMADGEDIDYTYHETLLEVFTKETLSDESVIEITLQFEAYIPKMNHRTGSNDHAVWLGNFLPQIAVYEKGNWRGDPYYPAGDPFYSEIANYNVTVTAPAAYSISATGIEAEREENGVKITTVSAKMVRDFALVLMDRSYTLTKIKTQSNVDVNFYYRSPVYHIDSYMDKIEEALDFFSMTIGAYPYDQLDIVETGFFLAGAMEYPQIIFVDTDFLMNSNTVENTLVHEIGHQWFYNIIGSDQINHPWMDEGLTMMLQEFILTESTEAFHEKFQQEYEVFKENLNSSNAYMLSDGIDKYSNWSDYYRTHYTKGKLMVYNLYLKMGEEKFNEFLRLYYSKYSFKNASINDFIDTAGEVYDGNLSEFFDIWLYNRDLPSMEVFIVQQ